MPDSASVRLANCSLVVAALATACSAGGSKQPMTATTPTTKATSITSSDPIPTATASTATTPLPPPPDHDAVLASIDTSTLTGSERDEVLRALDSTPSPCGDAFTLSTCLAEHRACDACVPAAKDAIRYVHEGEDAASIRGFIDWRFGKGTLFPDVAENGGPTLGPADAKARVIEFVDFQCPVCGEMAPLVKKAVETPGIVGKVRLVFANFPLDQHVHAKDAARAGIAADAQGKFWPMAALMLSHQDALDPPSLAGWAKQAGCDVNKWRKVFEAETTRARVEADRQRAIDLGVDATPTIVIDRRKWVPMGTAPYEEQIARWIAEDLGG